MKSQQLSSYILLLILIFTLNSTFHQNTQVLGNNKQLSQHSSLQITSDADLQQLAANEKWKGDGTKQNPIMIEGYSFTDNPIANSSIFTQVSNSYQYKFRGFTSFNLILTNVSLHVKIEGNNFSSSVLIVNSNNITINANNWDNQWNPNNLFIATTWEQPTSLSVPKNVNIRISDNTFFGGNDFCTIDGLFLPSPRLVLYGGGIVVHHNVFEMDVGCYPILDIYLENNIIPVKGGPEIVPMRTSITNNLFQANDYPIIAHNVYFDVFNNDFNVGDFGINAYFSEPYIKHNNFYVSHIGVQGKQNYTDIIYYYVGAIWQRENPPAGSIPTLNPYRIWEPNYYSTWIAPDNDHDGIVDRSLNNITMPYIPASTTPFPGYDEEVKSKRDEPLQIVIGILIGLIAVGYGLKKLDSVMQSRKVIFNGDLHGTSKELIKELFESQTILYYTLVGQSRLGDKDLESNIRQGIPRNILDFKFLLHPLRLSMAKLLYENLELSSVDIKDILNISWNDYTTHSTAMKKKGYINITERFSEGNKRQILTLEPKGIEEYKILLDLLHLFLDNSTDLSAYIQTAQQRLEQTDPDLYPNV